LDGQLARQDSELATLLDRFVCVRIVQAYGLDLSLFQCDGELTFAAFFMNADRTVYGRYGTRTSHDGDETVSLSGFREAMEATLKLHAGYPANKATLVGKQGGVPRWKTPELIPQLPGPKVPADGSRGKCVHCHEVGIGTLLSMRQAKQKPPDWILWSFPNPSVLGLEFDFARRATLKNFKEESPAFEAGLRVGDEIETVDGQPITSVADVQWAFEQKPAPSEAAITVTRNGKIESLRLKLAAGWRRADDFTWRTLSWPLRLRLCGFRLAPIGDAERTRLKLPADQTAFKVAELPPTWLKDANRSPEKAGLKKGDVVLGFDGRTSFGEKDLLAAVALDKLPGDEMTVTVLRGGKTVDIRFTVK
jgi:serine protease Do